MIDFRYDYVEHFRKLRISRNALARYISENIRPISANTVQLAIRAPEEATIEVRSVMIRAIKQIEKERGNG